MAAVSLRKIGSLIGLIGFSKVAIHLSGDLARYNKYKIHIDTYTL